MPFRIGEREIAAHQQQHADGGHLSYLARSIQNFASGGRVDDEQDARNQKADAAHQRGGDFLHRNIDREVGGSPEEINEAEGEIDHPPAWALSGVHWAEELQRIRRQKAVVRF